MSQRLDRSGASAKNAADAYSPTEELSGNGYLTDVWKLLNPLET